MGGIEQKKYNLKIDPVLIAIFLISIVSRYYNLDHPRAVVFDELHYIKFITLYLKRIFFFDPQPPFGKQLLSLAAYFAGYDGDLEYTHIGDIYKPEVPIRLLRLIPCISGSLLAPLCYLISLELGYRKVIAGFVSVIVILENSLLTQSRFILLEPILIAFSLSSLYCYLKFKKHLSTTWLCGASIFAILATCIKFSGFYSYVLLLGLVIKTWWDLLDIIEFDKLVKKTISILSLSIIVPIAVYICVYYIHLSWLIRAGPHDHIMSSAFQASLENGLASITRGQPLEIAHGSQITLRHSYGRSCWLHSHEHLYPIKYQDGRGSSHQQQVTCYSFKDVNNWWIVKKPDIEELVVTEPIHRIKDGHLIQLVHGLTGRVLNSHDVASAMSPYSQEVSCYIDHNISMPAQDLWQVKLINPEETNNNWHTLNSKIRLIHYNSSLALRFSGRQLPDWGFHQHEIVTDRELKSDDTIWNVEEHRYTKSDDQKEREIQLGQAEFVPLEPTNLTFFEKFIELHYKLLTYQQDSLKDHIYASESPLDWVFLNRGTAYWVEASPHSNAQIFLIGNVDTGLFGIFSLISFMLMILYYGLLNRRQILLEIGSVRWVKIQQQATILLSGYFVHLLPYFFYDPPLFLQCYLNALVYKILIIGALLDHIYELISWKHLIHGLLVAIIAKITLTTIKLIPLSYGYTLTDDQVEQLRWKETWQLISSKP